MKCQNVNSNKTIHKCFYDLQKIPKEEYLNENVVWVPLCTDVQRQPLCVDTFADNRFFVVKKLIPPRWKKYMKNYSIILWYLLMTNTIFASKKINHSDKTWWEIMGLLKMTRLIIEILKLYNY